MAQPEVLRPLLRYRPRSWLPATALRRKEWMVAMPLGFCFHAKAILRRSRVRHSLSGVASDGHPGRMGCRGDRSGRTRRAAVLWLSGDLSVGETDDAGLGLLWGGLSEVEEREQLAPGERGVVRTYFVNPDVARRFPVGRDFTVNEGRTVVARGRVLEHLTDEPSSRG